MIGRALLAWLVILVAGNVNGLVRAVFLRPLLGTPWTLVTSGLLLIAIVLVVTWVFVRRVPMPPRTALGVGALWLVLTLAFELGFGRLVSHRSWEEIVAAYRFTDGNLWPVVLGVVLFAPWAASLLQAR